MIITELSKKITLLLWPIDHNGEFNIYESQLKWLPLNKLARLMESRIDLIVLKM